MLPLLLISGFITCTLCVPRQYTFVNESKTWTEAQSYCRDKYTDLVTVENEQETVQLLNTVNDYNSTDLAWIGLYDDLNSWKWALEDSEFFSQEQKQFRNWYKQEPVNYGGQSLCVYMYAYYGRWYTANCDNTLLLSAMTLTDTAEKITQTLSVSGMKMKTRRSEIHSRITITGAFGLVCTELDLGQIRVTLHSVTGGQENRSNAGNSEHCTAVSFSDDGKWTDENCNNILPFICYNLSYLASSRQYHFITVNKSWSEAQTYCRQNYIDLATIDNMTEMNSVMNTVNGSYNGSAWIGQYDDVNSWRWSLDDDDFYQDGEREFRNWNHQPDNYGGNELCVYMNYDGEWFDSSCDNPLSFVCYNRSSITQSYVRVDDGRSWTEAQRYCREYHTDLANVRNQTENQKILEITGGNVWIGLYRNRIWSNGQNTKYLNWKPETPYSYPQPDNGNYAYGQRGNQRCTAVSFRYSGRWTDENCLSNMPFICYSRTCTQSSCSVHQYHFISENKSWSEAQTYCRQNYIDLATIDNMTEMNKLIKTVRGIYFGSAWIGLYDDLKIWRWSLGNTELGGGFKSWYVQQPTNWNGQRLCVSVILQRNME
ncbi:macrophage mannose receptor 1-like [Triplophysa dalaica]|uniref:macrophage mannose receptor 1-like n=1 Tax=Triplophysa dalaica TaxID=1582913 RepID=UPI0024E0256F|nr:macrophage mannose receptor 1-like [Triplophysa dalaica]